jgi:hypothetical protein
MNQTMKQSNNKILYLINYLGKNKKNTSRMVRIRLSWLTRCVAGKTTTSGVRRRVAAWLAEKDMAQPVPVEVAVLWYDLPTIRSITLTTVDQWWRGGLRMVAGDNRWRMINIEMVRRMHQFDGVGEERRTGERNVWGE